MSSISPPINSDEKKILGSCHKETQTSNTSLKDRETATGTGNIDACDRGSLKVFEFNQILQDLKRPGEITIIKDIFAEEIHDHNNLSETPSDDALANRYTYCREVIKPYLKDYPKNCPVSDDQLIRDALDAAQEDFPDYEPCFEEYDDNQRDISEKKDNSGNKSSSLTKLDSKDNIPTLKTSICLKKGIINKSDSCTSTGSLKSNMDKDNACPPKVRDKRCPKKCPHPPIDPCVNENDPPPGPPSICGTDTQGTSIPCKNKPSVGPCPEKIPEPKKDVCQNPRNEMRESSRKSIFQRTSSAITPKEENKTILPGHSEAITSIKSAVEDFFGKVYQTTKEAVTVIKTESAKHLGRITARKSASNAELFPQSVHENKSNETITSFNYFRPTEDPKTQSTENDGPDNDVRSKAGQAIGKIFAKVDSTISMISDQVDLQKVTSFLKFDTPVDKSSPYDKLASETEEPVATSTSLPNSVFTAIKSKIVSMFSEGESEVKELSKKSSTSSASDRKSE